MPMNHIDMNTIEMSDTEKVIERSESSIGRTINNYRLVTQDGEHLMFHSLKGKIVLLDFIYLDCPDMCIMMSYSLQDLMDKMDPSLLGKFVILSVSFNPIKDTPEKLKAYGLDFTSDFSNWHFVTASLNSIADMVEELGFTYKKDDDGFSHLNRLTLFGADGKVMKHFYGTDFSPKEVEASIKDALAGNLMPTKFSLFLNKVVLSCSYYDARNNVYKIDYLLIGTYIIEYVLILLTLLFFFREQIANLFSRNKHKSDKSHIG